MKLYIVLSPIEISRTRAKATRKNAIQCGSVPCILLGFYEKQKYMNLCNYTNLLASNLLLNSLRWG